MPGFDRTGPWGQGPMTGGGFGRCNPHGARSRSFFGRSFGRGRWAGRGFGRRGFAPAWGGWYDDPYGGSYDTDPVTDLEMLRDEASALRDKLDAINRRMEELKSQGIQPEA